jgi:hypothetical protein
MAMTTTITFFAPAKSGNFFSWSQRIIAATHFESSDKIRVGKEVLNIPKGGSIDIQ